MKIKAFVRGCRHEEPALKTLWKIIASALLVYGMLGAEGGLSAAKNTRAVKVMAFGDSLTAGYGLPAREGFVSRLEAALKAEGYNVTIINAGVSGDTTAGGKARLDWSLAERPDAVLLELGANDALRGLSPAASEANLDAMLNVLKERKIPVLLIGMKSPPNLGAEYGTAFEAIYPRLAARYGVPLYPFFLDGVAANSTLNQADGIHPNAAGVHEIVRRILPAVTKFLDTLP